MNTSTLALLKKHFDLAIIAPDGIKRLRELILTLAMQGKLVPQDATDHPACELLKEIESEKKRLVKEGKIKEPKPLPEIKAEDVPYAVPKGWEWVRLGSVASVNGGFAFKSSQYNDNGMRVIRISDFDEKGFKNGKIVRHFFSSDLNFFRLEVDNIIMAMTGGTVGKSLLVKVLPEPMVVNQRVATIKIKKRILPEYIDILLRTPFIQNIIQNAKNSTNDNISMGDITGFLIPLPPLAEQKRIVAKIDQLMAACDVLEKQRNSQQQMRQNIHSVTITRLLDAANLADADNAWNFLQKHFSELYSVKENVVELRKAVLQLAVMGKLVRQDPTEQPASELLKEIEAEKKRLVKEGEIKVQKELHGMSKGKFPYTIPDSWKWIKLEEVCTLITDGTHLTPQYINDGIPFLSVKNLSSGKIDFKDSKYISHKEHQELSKRCKPEYGDILLTKIGTTGIAIVVDTDIEFSIFVSVALLKIISKKIFPKFFERLINSPLVKKYSADGTEGVGNKNLVLRKIREYVIPIPPLAEQKRIVAKIDELMLLCDKLEQGIDNATKKQSAVLEAVVAQV